MTPVDPMPHQWEAIEEIVSRSALLVHHGTGCISGSAKISINRGGKGWTLPLSELVRMANGGRAVTRSGNYKGARWNSAIPTYAQQERDGVVRLVRLLKAWCSGIKHTYIVTTQSGKTVRATDEHPFLTERGWLRLDELEIGDLVHVRGEQFQGGRGPKPQYIETHNVGAHPHARLHRRPDRPRDQTRVAQHRLVAEADLNGMSYDQYLERIRDGHIAGLIFLSPDGQEVHHLDRDGKNNHPDNLEVLDSDEHPRLHAEEGTFKNVLFKIDHDPVVSIKPYGPEITYDLEVADEPHNFLANGFVVHNTGKTRSAIEAIDVIVGAGEIPILHVVPNSLIEQTVEEYTRWLGTGWVDRHLAVLDGKLSITQRAEALSGLSKWFSYGSVYLLSTEALSYKQIREGIRRRDWAAAFVDEGSRFRNYSARTRTLQVLGQRARSRYVFSGNIMPRNPADLWYIMNFLVPRIFGSNNIQTFKSEYCILGGFTGMQVMGVRPDKIDKLKAIVDAHSIRAELSDIRSDMPTRSLTVRKVSLKTGTQTNTYVQMRDTLRAEIERMSAEEFRTQASTYSVRLLRLQEIAAGFSRNVEGDVEIFGSNKTEEMLDMLQDTPDQPTIIWYWWTPELKLIEAALSKEGLPFITFTKAGDGSRDRFMRGEANIYISQLAKGAYGLNLTRATRMIYHSLPWDLDSYLQSQERNMRLTTTADHLEIEHLVVKGTVDEYVRQKLLAKAGISRALSKSDALAMLK